MEIPFRIPSLVLSLTIALRYFLSLLWGLLATKSFDSMGYLIRLYKKKRNR
jgi:hypothetical protein